MDGDELAVLGDVEVDSDGFAKSDSQDNFDNMVSKFNASCSQDSL